MIHAKSSKARVVGTIAILIADALGAQQGAIAAPNARFERLFDGGFFLEGPAVAPAASLTR